MRAGLFGDRRLPLKGGYHLVLVQAHPALRGHLGRRRLFRWALLGTMGAIVAQAGIGFTYFFYAQKTGTFGGIVRAGNLKVL